MNINDFVKAQSVALYLGSRSRATSGSAASTGLSAQPGFQRVEKRIQAQVDSTTAQLSSFGKLKSALYDTQVAARALEGVAAASPTAAALQTAVRNVATAFNSAVEAAKATASSQNASRPGKDLVAALSTNLPITDALKSLGFNLGLDGKLVLDRSAFDTQYKADPTAALASLATLGQQVYAVTSKALGAEGSLGLALSSLNQQSSILKTQQAMLASLGTIGSNSSSNTPSQTSYGNGAYDFGLAAYRKSLVSNT